MLGALRLLRIEVAYEDPRRLIVVRGAVLKQHIPKFDELPVTFQRRVILAFSIDEAAYLEALARHCRGPRQH